MNEIQNKFIRIFGKLPNSIQLIELFKLLIICDGLEISCHEVCGFERKTEYCFSLKDYQFEEPESDQSEPIEVCNTFEDGILECLLLIDDYFGRHNEIYSIYENVNKILKEDKDGNK